ncbi:enoyl-CoA hydratase/isomerase family protein [Rhodohalobacter sp. 8-1]|uniref:enoyl-CoA hydratase/isomerase family protein n=1 Tax=Rhodohalobacter sp. 8-1 TaxID=3131972 RepID=UPI0030EC03B7
MAHTYQTIELKVDDNSIAHLTINRPKKLNALNNQVLDEIDLAIDTIEMDSDVKAILLKGAGDKAFVAGADISELAELDGPGGEEASKKGQTIFDRIEKLDKPVVAVVDGYALGGGAELAMAAHIRVASESAVIGLPEVSLGLIPGYGGTQRLPALVGKAKAFEMILTGQPIKADEALSSGLVNKVTDNAEEAAQSMIHTILKNGPVAVLKALQAIRAAGSPVGFETEATLFGELCETEDFKEGTTAFMEKRKPDFSGK